MNEYLLKRPTVGYSMHVDMSKSSSLRLVVRLLVYVLSAKQAAKVNSPSLISAEHTKEILLIYIIIVTCPQVP